MKRISTLLFLLIIGITLAAKELPNKQSVKPLLPANLIQLIDNYIKKISKDCNIKIVARQACEDSELRIEDYHNDIFTYSINNLTIVNGLLNNDATDDYIVSYNGRNCWRGNGAQNYLSNFFFIISINNQLRIDESLTHKFKKDLLTALNKKHGKTEKQEVRKINFINGIEITSINEGTIYGSYEINTNRCLSAHPCAKGDFRYDTSNNELNLY